MASTRVVNSAGTSVRSMGVWLSTPRAAMVPARRDRLLSIWPKPQATTIQPSGIVMRMGSEASRAAVRARLWRGLTRCDTCTVLAPSVARKLRQRSLPRRASPKPGSGGGGMAMPASEV